MSKIALSGDASGTGTFTIASPNSNSNFTLTLPAESGTVLTTGSTTGISASALSTGTIPIARMYAGAVLQVVSAVYTTRQSFSTTSGVYQSTGLTATITPTSASSKILILVTATHQSYYLSTANTGSSLGLNRNSTKIAGFVGSHVGTVNNAETLAPTGSMTVLDSPATTSATTYTVLVTSLGASQTVYFNGTYAVTGFESFITLMEIAA